MRGQVTKMATRFEFTDEVGKRRILMTRDDDGALVEVGEDGKPVKVSGPQDLQALTLDVRDRDYQLYQRLKHGEEMNDLLSSARTADSFLDALEVFLRKLVRRR